MDLGWLSQTVGGLNHLLFEWSPVVFVGAAVWILVFVRVVGGVEWGKRAVYFPPAGWSFAWRHWHEGGRYPFVLMVVAASVYLGERYRFHVGDLFAPYRGLLPLLAWFALATGRRALHGRRVCRRCLRRLEPVHALHLAGICRGCSDRFPTLADRTDGLYQPVKEIVAVVASPPSNDGPPAHEHGQLRVPWRNRDGHFAFERVEILDATDGEVEEFAIAVANDADEGRHGANTGAPVIVSPEASLSPNTLSILETTFTEVRRPDR